MMSKKIKKIIVSVCSLALVACISVGATLAYLTSQTETVQNTFTVGQVKITLDETDVDMYGEEDGNTRVIKNEYKLIPGHTYTKDPIVHVEKGSEQSWLFVKVVDGIADIEDTTTIAAQMTAKGWIALTGVENVYYYRDVVDARTTAVDVNVFDSFKLKNDADVAEYADAKITIEAYAVQADGFSTAAAAWAAAPATWKDGATSEPTVEPTETPAGE